MKTGISIILPALASSLLLFSQPVRAQSLTLTTLHSFSALSGRTNTDGASPVGGLIQASDGNFYGTADGGGGNGNGTIFKITSGGSFVTPVFYTFSALDGNGNNTDGGSPEARLIQGSGSDTNLYGTAFADGTDNEGSVFKISLAGTFTTLHLFGNTDGGNPYAPLYQHYDGYFYGTTQNGGTDSYGTIFRIESTGGTTFSSLLGFEYGDGDPEYPSGASPLGGLVAANGGYLFGTTGAYGLSGGGTIFSFNPVADTAATLIDLVERTAQLKR